MNKLAWLIVLVAGILVIGAGCGKKDDTTNTDLLDNFGINESLTNTDLNVNENVNAVGGEEIVNEDVNTNAEVVNTNVSTNTNTAPEATNTNTAVTEESAAGTITITSPTKDQELTSPFYVEGTAGGSKAYIRVKGSSGTTIFTEPVSVNSEGKYRGKLLFEFTQTTAGTIEVFSQDAAGTETDIASVTVKFKTVTDANTNTTTETNINSAANTNISE